MRLLGTLVLSGVLVAMLAYIVVLEEADRDRKDTSATGPAGELLIPALSAGSGEVTSLRWSTALVSVSLAKNDAGRWLVRIAGRDVPCDALQVEELLTVARRCRVIRVIRGDEIGEESLSVYRLAPPAATLAITSGGVTYSVGLGALSPAHERVYARRHGEADVLLVDSSLTEALASTGPADLRQRRMIDWSVNELHGVEVRGPEGTLFRAARETVRHEWRATVPFEDFVDPLKIDSGLLPEIVRLEVDEFVKDGVPPEGLSRFGLAAPRLDIRLLRGTESGGAEARRVFIGGDVPGRKGFAYVMEDGLPFVLACRVDMLLRAVAGDWHGFRDRNITRIGETPLVRISVRYPPAEDFEFLFEHGAWLLEKPERQALDPRALGDWLDFMRDLSAVGFVERPDLSALGLADPRGELLFRAPGEGGEIAVLRLLIGEATPDGEGIYVRREGAAYAVIAPAGLHQRLADGHFRVKDRAVLRANWVKLEPLAIEQRVDGEDRAHVYREEKWSEGSHVAAIEAILLCLPRLTTERWIGRASGGYGLDGAVATVIRCTFHDVTARDEGKRVIGVQIGSRTEGGHFARAVRDGRPGPDVFLLSAADYRILTQTISK